MAKFQFAEAYQVIPLLVPATATNDTAKVSSFVDLSQAHWCTFIAQFGAISVTDTGLITVAVSGSTTGADSDTVANVNFSYRITNAPGAATSAGTITACASTNTNTVASTDVANALLIVEVDPAEVNAYRYVRLSLDPAADTTAWTVDVIGVLDPRYPGNAIPSFTTT